MQAIKTTGYVGSSTNVGNLSMGSHGSAPNPAMRRDSIVEAERRGNLVIASLAFCLLSGVVMLAVS